MTPTLQNYLIISSFIFPYVSLTHIGATTYNRLLLLKEAINSNCNLTLNGLRSLCLRRVVNKNHDRKVVNVVCVGVAA